MRGAGCWLFPLSRPYPLMLSHPAQGSEELTVIESLLLLPGG